MAKVSVCMIVKNEAEVLERCLKSLGDFPDQLVIVDTGSTDDTVAIAKRFGAEVHHFKWVQDFAAARNFSLEKATHPYILWLDADDVIKPEELVKLKALKPNLTEDMYLVAYDYAQDENGKSLSTLFRERIVRNDPRFRFRYPIHECIPLIHGATTKQTDITITHKRTGAGYSADLNRNIVMLEAALKRPEYQNDARVQYYLAKECYDAGQWEKAANELRKFMDMNDGWWEDRICAIHKLAECYRALSKADLAKDEALKAIKMDYRWAEPYYTLASLAMDQKDWHQAIQWFELCRRPIPSVLSPTRTEYYTWLPNLQLCVCYNEIGNVKMAYERNKEALQYKPNDSRMINNDKILSKALSLPAFQPEVPQKPPPKEVPQKQKEKGLRVGWVYAGAPIEAPQYRIRTYNISKWLSNQGYTSDIIGEDQIDKYPIVIFSRNASDYLRIKKAKSQGKIVILDLCEALFEFNIPEYTGSIEESNLVVCCSYKLAEMVREKTKQTNVVVIEDAVEADYNQNCDYNQSPSVVWCGMGGSSHHAEKLRPLIESLGLTLTTIHEHANADVPWNKDTWQQEILKHNIAIIPIDANLQPAKSNNRLTMFMALGLPTIVSPLPAYTRIIQHGVNGFVANTDDEWRDCLDKLRSAAVRTEVGQAGKVVAKQYDVDHIGKQWVEVIRSIEDKTVDIIIPTYKNVSYLRECIKSIKACTNYPHNIIVVNGNVHDETSEFLSKEFPDVIRIDVGKRVNFSEANNIGIKHSRAPYVCFMNDDIIVSRNWLPPLMEQLREGVAMVNPLSNCDKGWLHNYSMFVGEVPMGPGSQSLENGKIVAKDRWGKYTAGFESKTADPELVYDVKSPSNRVYQRDWVAMFCTLTSRDAISRVGLLDEEFHTGSEDLDYCMRANRLGYKCAVSEKSFVLHFGGVSRKAHEDENHAKHQEEDRYNNDRIQHKYGKPLVVIQTGHAWEAWDYNSLKTGIGGSEIWAICLAEEFAKLGVRVVVFANTGKPKPEIANGVEWYNNSEWHRFIDMNYIDVCIVSRYVEFFGTPIRAGKKYLFLHDIFAMCARQGDKDLVQEHYNQFDGIFVLSQWHKEFASDYHKIPQDKFIISGHGLKMERFV